MRERRYSRHEPEHRAAAGLSNLPTSARPKSAAIGDLERDGEGDDADAVVEQGFAGHVIFERGRRVERFQRGERRNRIGRGDDGAEHETPRKTDGNADRVERSKIRTRRSPW